MPSSSISILSHAAPFVVPRRSHPSPPQNPSFIALRRRDPGDPLRNPLRASPSPAPRSARKAGAPVFAAAEGGAAAAAAPATSFLLQKLRLGALFGIWYILNIYFFIYNKQVLKVFPFPLTLTACQLAVGSVIVLFMWAVNLYEMPKLSTSQVLGILPMVIVHTLGNVFTNMSIGKVAVSFTNTIKAMEPFFSVLLSSLFLGEFPNAWVLVSLVPIVGGVALASLTEVSFNWIGFWSAMASNLTYQSRNVLSKKLMVNKEKSLDNISLFSIMTIMSLFLMAPLALFVEGIRFTPASVQATGFNLRDVYLRGLLAGICFHAYQQVSYMILAEVSPVTHSIGNCVKRVVVIVCSVLAFRTPVMLVNSIGTGTALAGVFMYSRAKRIKSVPT